MMFFPAQATEVPLQMRDPQGPIMPSKLQEGERPKKPCTIQSVNEAKRLRSLVQEDRKNLAYRRGARAERLFSEQIAKEASKVTYRTSTVEEAIERLKSVKAKIDEALGPQASPQIPTAFYQDFMSMRYNQPINY